jgi:hypothetical protein
MPEHLTTADYVPFQKNELLLEGQCVFGDNAEDVLSA